jgi:TetR/AcrR family transcriptional regulator, tetracycline repressor protein
MAANRAAWGTISREQIVAAATRIVRAGAYEEMTMRSLASALGVSPMSLYRHVRDKDDILDEVVDHLLARVWRPKTAHVEWEEWITLTADKLRRFLVAQPAAMHVYLRHPVVTPAAIERMNAMMDVLRGALPDDDTARRAYAAIHTYTVGFAALESSRSGWSDTSDDADELVLQLATYTTREQFINGLHALIRGIQH